MRRNEDGSLLPLGALELQGGAPTAEPVEELRMYIVFRADLPEMTRAKGEVQAAHAAASLIYVGAHAKPIEMAQYMDYAFGEASNKLVTPGQVKIIMEVDGIDALHLVANKASARGVTNILIQDAARTVFGEPTITCIGIGPCTKADGNAITRRARMRS